MSNFLFSVNTVVPLFVIIIVGWLLTKLKIWDGSFLKTGNNFSFSVLIAAMLFYNIYNSDFSSAFNSKLLVFVICAVLVICLVSIILVPLLTKENARRGVIIQGLFRGNYVLLGLPLCDALFGAEGVQAASVFSAFVIPIFNVLATVILSVYGNKKCDSVWVIVKKTVTNPLIIASILGVIFVFLKIPLPNVVMKPLKDLSAMATPFALLVLGGDFKFESFISNLKCVAATGLSRLLLIPAAVTLAAYLFGFKGVDIAILISVFATPVAVSSTPMTYKMNGDYDLSCQIVVFTTAFSVLSIIFLVFMCKTLGII